MSVFEDRWSLVVVLMGFLLSFNGLHAQERSVSFTLDEPFLIDVESRGMTLAFNLPPMSLNASHTAEFQARFQPDLQESAQFLPQVTLVLIYGNESLSWFMANHSRSSSKRLCFSSPPDSNGVSLVVHAAKPTKIELRIKSVDMGLPFGEGKVTPVALNHPVTFLVDPVPEGSLGDRYLLRVDSQDPGSDHFCMIVAAYANACPFKDKPGTVRNAEMWMTVLTKGAMTIRSEDARFSMPFYVTLLVLESDGDCHQSNFQVPHYSSFSRARSKEMKVLIQRTSRNDSYLYPILVLIFVSVLMGILGMCVMMGKRFEDADAKADDTAPHDNPSVYLSARASREDIADNGGAVLGYDETDELDGNYLRPHVTSPNPSTSSSHKSHEQDYLQPVIPSSSNGDTNPDPRPSKSRPDIDDLKRRCLDSVPENSTRRARVEKGLERLNENTNLGHMTHILEDDPWFRRNRSRVYCYLVPLLALFYFIPSIQFVFLVKESESVTGSQDLCYHNFLCSKHWTIFSDFNHVVSNLPYMIYGIMFALLVLFKSSKLPPGQNPKNDHKAGKGILQQLSIFYAMGFSLTAQGFFSICYHVCPTNHSLQFDSTMMYVMCMLGCVKIYQFRHPDANANAYSFFYFLGGIVLLEAITLYSYSWWWYSVFLILYVAMTVFIAIDCYFIGVARLDIEITKILIKDVFYTSWKGGSNGERVGIRYPKRFGFAMVFCLINFTHVLYLLVAKVKRPEKSVTHVVLLILAGNLFLYIGYYIFRKNQMRCKILGKSLCCRDGDQVDASYSYPNPFCPNHRIPIFISAGSIFALLSFICALTAITFYLDRSANRNLSPAESRILNEDCAYFNFYDSHDAWHFLSATAIFMAFLALLTVDDDQIHVPRELIEVF